MKKILLLANNDMGLYKFRKELIQHLCKDNQVFISVPCADYKDELDKFGCTIYDTQINRHGMNPFKEFKILKYYCKLIDIVKPDIVLSYTIKPNIYGGIACRLKNIPFAPNITGLGVAITKNNILSNILLKMYKFSLSGAKNVFFQNTQNLNLFLRKKIINNNNNYTLLPGSGVNLETNSYAEYPEEKYEQNFLFVGRLMKDKGIVELIYAFNELQSKYPNIKLNVVGGAEDDFKIELSQIEIKSNIIFWGKQKDVRRFMKDSNAIIVPSYHEGMSNVCLEAAACGRPILASQIAGCIETFDEGVSGIGFRARNVKSLIDAVDKFLSLSYDEKRKMGQAGRKKVESAFDRNIIVQKYTELIEQI